MRTIMKNSQQLQKRSEQYCRILGKSSSCYDVRVGFGVGDVQVLSEKWPIFRRSRLKREMDELPLGVNRREPDLHADGARAVEQNLGC